MEQNPFICFNHNAPCSNFEDVFGGKYSMQTGFYFAVKLVLSGVQIP
jgi:hypothetical protein